MYTMSKSFRCIGLEYIMIVYLRDYVVLEAASFQEKAETISTCQRRQV